MARPKTIDVRTAQAVLAHFAPDAEFDFASAASNIYTNAAGEMVFIPPADSSQPGTQEPESAESGDDGVEDEPTQASDQDDSAAPAASTGSEQRAATAPLKIPPIRTMTSQSQPPAERDASKMSDEDAIKWFDAQMSPGPEQLVHD